MSILDELFELNGAYLFLISVLSNSEELSYLVVL